MRGKVHREVSTFIVCFCCSILRNESNFGSANYSTCVVYTKTIIHLSVGESGGDLPPLWWIIVKYYTRKRCINKEQPWPRLINYKWNILSGQARRYVDRQAIIASLHSKATTRNLVSKTWYSKPLLKAVQPLFGNETIHCKQQKI